MAEKPWYRDGLRFQCTGCGGCCTGAPGYVWVTKGEIEAMAQALDTTVAEFEKRYVRQVGIRKSLIELANGDCIFLDAGQRRCTLYEARPRQCRTWPFWSSNLASPERWQETCEACPGSGVGRLVPLEEIEEQMARMRV
jgi:Fe-S-cluster containining protein